jgi:Domain of unknown function (DUF5658)
MVGEPRGSSGRTTPAAAQPGSRVWAVPLLDRQVSVQRCYLAISLVVLNLLDVVLTKGVLDRGGVEANPIMADLMAGTAGPIGVKLAVSTTAGLLLMMCPPESRLADRAAVAVAGLYGAVVVWNAALLSWLLVTGA